MAYFTGKSGADAVFKNLHHICKVLGRYQTKLIAAIEAARAGGVIDDDQAGTATLFVTSATVLCAIFEKVASNSGFGG